MPIPSDEGIPSLGDLLGDTGGGIIAVVISVPEGLSGLSRVYWLNQTNQMNQTDQTLERYTQARHDDSTTL